MPRWTSRVRVPFPAPPSPRPQLDPAASPSGKATVCKTVIPSSSLGAASILSLGARGAAPAGSGGAAGAAPAASDAPHPARQGSRSAETRVTPTPEYPLCGAGEAADSRSRRARMWPEFVRKRRRDPVPHGSLAERVHASVARSRCREMRTSRPATGTTASTEWKLQLVGFHAVRMVHALHAPVPARVHASARTASASRSGGASRARERGFAAQGHAS